MPEILIASTEAIENLQQSIKNYITIIESPKISEHTQGHIVEYNDGLEPILSLRDRNKNYMNYLNKQDDPISVDYEDQMVNLEKIETFLEEKQILSEKTKVMENEKSKIEDEKNYLASELASCKEMIETKKIQHSRLLAELTETRHKLNRMVQLNKKKQTDDNELDYSVAEEIDKMVEEIETYNLSSENRWNLSVVDEHGNQSNTLGVTDNQRNREEEIKEFYKNNTKQLHQQLKKLDEKALEYMVRAEELEISLATAIAEKDQYKAEAENASQDKKNAVDELNTTRSSLEQQLELLSEHLVHQNDKISDYEEELSTLKNCRVRCGKCKTWNTIAWLMKEGKNGRYCSRGNHASSFNFA
eukprot:TRINITY_DN4201_c0_g4_i1.p1 TRINITY_DN4201_c0_g4~~TRINITY_DN4201_c0_g4_i1.p1  ORF type:complete len:412 (-),score=106.29 TRINITY_DN4201_c0_g4_i1:49-1125(-)